jgi:hypothetical protein
MDSIYICFHNNIYFCSLNHSFLFPKLMNKLPLYLLFLLLAGCITVTNKNAEETTFREVKIKDLYSVQLPTYLVPSKTLLNDDASLQYSDSMRNMYVIVIDEIRSNLTVNNKAITLVEFFDTSTSNIVGSLTQVQSSNPEQVKVNGLDAYKVTIVGRHDQLTMVYKCYIIESMSHFYQVYCWTVADLLPNNEKDMDVVLNSFKELPAKNNSAQ